ncbi:hypothetical protein Hte_010672 [Hypoxylon texense]
MASQLNHAAEYQRLLEEQPELKRFNHTRKIAVALDSIGVKRDAILEKLDNGLSDFWIPMRQDHYPRGLKPGQEAEFRRIQSQFLTESFEVEAGEHFNLDQKSINEDYSIPRQLRYKRTLSAGNGPRPTTIQEVVDPSGRVYVLKRIKRRHTYEEEQEEMKYIKGELSIMKKMRGVSLRHFIQLVASYTEINYVGLLLHPRAECHLGEFLDKFNQGEQRDENLLLQFFGCIATAIAFLHCHTSVRHKDLKPENFLVKGTNILLIDFGISLDFSATNITTTNEEKRRTIRYCAPEVAQSKPRNSSSDVWSLGCVFLEMIAVLNGNARKDIYNILSNHGQPNFCHSEEAVNDVIEWLRGQNSIHQMPLLWVKRMIPWKSDKRITARELRDRIFRDGKMYSGLCCYKTNLDEFAPPKQITQDTLIASYPAKILLLNSVGRLHEVKMATCPGLTNNWISSSVVTQYNSKAHSRANTEHDDWKEGRLESTEYVEVTWTLKDLNKTSRDEFMVVPRLVGFDMLVTPESYESLRSPATSKRAR